MRTELRVVTAGLAVGVADYVTPAASCPANVSVTTELRSAPGMPQSHLYLEVVGTLLACFYPNCVIGVEMSGHMSQFETGFPAVRTPWLLALLLSLLVLPLIAVDALAHNVTEGDKGYIQEIVGPHLVPFLYLGAKHMVTGYDHLLFLLGVIFFLYRLKHVAIYVSLFALGHSLTMISGVYFGWQVNAHLIDAIIGLSVVYKALDNLGAFQRWFGFQPDTKLATLIFGLFHGLGLATKILDYDIAPYGLLPNLLAFNAGVELGQIWALAVMLIIMGYWRRTTTFTKHAYTANVVIMTAGFMLVGYQLTGYAVT